MHIEQEVVGRTNSLLSFDMKHTTCKMIHKENTFGLVYTSLWEGETWSSAQGAYTERPILFLVEEQTPLPSTDKGRCKTEISHKPALGE
jgi:hypothetical protein